MQGEAALVAEDVESFAVGIARCGRVVLTLVQERTCLLPLQRLEAVKEMTRIEK